MAISQKAFPGCAVFASVRGTTILNQTYGYHSYDSLIKVAQDDLYDLASVTKVLASTLAMMKLYELGKIDLDAPIKQYVDGLGLSRVGRTTVRACMAHQAGLQSWIKFYKEIENTNGRYKRKTISDSRSTDYPFEIAQGKYLHKDFYKKIKKMIRKSDVAATPEYVYSGLFFYLIPEIIETQSGLDIQTFLKQYFYDSLKASSLTYKPLEKFNRNQIVPTEIDTFFRNESIHGTVHDEGAILMRGMSGNAGLFGNVNDVARVMTMLLNNGSIDSKQYLHPATIDLFTSYQYPNKNNRRGLGFDKPLLEYDSLISSVSKDVSVFSYGHTGYTGTLVWADPIDQVLFIFLSNRVFPTRDNRIIYELNIRPQIHQFIYDYLEQKRTN